MAKDKEFKKASKPKPVNPYNPRPAPMGGGNGEGPPPRP